MVKNLWKKKKSILLLIHYPLQYMEMLLPSCLHHYFITYFSLENFKSFFFYFVSFPPPPILHFFYLFMCSLRGRSTKKKCYMNIGIVLMIEDKWKGRTMGWKAEDERDSSFPWCRSGTRSHPTSVLPKEPPAQASEQL